MSDLGKGNCRVLCVESWVLNQTMVKETFQNSVLGAMTDEANAGSKRNLNMTNNRKQAQPQAVLLN